MYHANKITNTMNWSTIRQLLMSLCQKENTSLFLNFHPLGPRRTSRTSRWTRNPGITWYTGGKGTGRITGISRMY